MGIDFNIFYGDGICVDTRKLTKKQKNTLKYIYKQSGNWDQGIYEDSYNDINNWILFTHKKHVDFGCNRMPVFIAKDDYLGNNIDSTCMILQEYVDEEKKNKFIEEYLDWVVNNAKGRYPKYDIIKVQSEDFRDLYKEILKNKNIVIGKLLAMWYS